MGIFLSAASNSSLEEASMINTKDLSPTGSPPLQNSFLPFKLDKHLEAGENNFFQDLQRFFRRGKNQALLMH
jgi:hypothetical protein